MDFLSGSPIYESNVKIVNTDLLLDSINHEYQELFYVIVGRIKPVLISNQVRFACSFGKDSNLVLSAGLEAHRQCLLENKISKDKPFIVTNIDTGVDDIFVRGQIRYEVQELKKYCLKHGINLVYRTARPPVRYSWAVMYLSGMKLPSFAKSSADCSVILKIDPAKQIESTLEREHGNIVTILGVRTDESAKRSHSIGKHGLNDAAYFEKQINGKVVRTFAPIFDISTDQVFAILRRSGSSPIVPTKYPVPTYKDHNKLLIKLYGDAQDTCPVSSYQPAAESKSGSCGIGSRFGCYTCLKVVKDKSADSRERYAQYDRVKYVKLIRDWMAHNADNMSLRTPMGKSMCDVTGAIVVQENTYSAATLEKLIWWFSQATREDYLFVERFKQLVADGKLLDDPGYREIYYDESLDDETKDFYLKHYVDSNSEQFIEPLTLEHIMMICAIHSRDGVALPPYRALHIWDSVWKGDYIAWPSLDETKIVDEVPEPRFYIGNFKRTATSKLGYLLSDERSCSQKTDFPFHGSVKHLVGQTFLTDISIEKIGKSAIKHVFTKRKITSKSKKDGVVRFTKGRMSVALSPVSKIRSKLMGVERLITFPMPTTERASSPDILVWDNNDVEAGFSLDIESLEMFCMTEYDRCLEKHDQFVSRFGDAKFGGTGPFIEMLSYGLIRLTSTSAKSSERMLARTEQLCNATREVNLLNLTKDQLNTITIDQAEYRRLRATEILAIRKMRKQHAKSIMDAASNKKNNPGKYLTEKLAEFTSSVKVAFNHLIVHKAYLEAIKSSGVNDFDGVNIDSYITAINYSIEQIVNPTLDVDSILSLFNMDRSNMALRKLAADELSAFNIWRTSLEKSDFVHDKSSIWHYLALNCSKFNEDEFIKVLFDVNRKYRLSEFSGSAYSSKKAFSIMQLPIFRVAP